MQPYFTHPFCSLPPPIHSPPPPPFSRLIVAWVLASACALGHVGHMWPAAPHWMHVLGSTAVHGVMSALALVGPGRQIIVDGMQALRRNAPGMWGGGVWGWGDMGWGCVGCVLGVCWVCVGCVLGRCVAVQCMSRTPQSLSYTHAHHTQNNPPRASPHPHPTPLPHTQI